MISTNLVDYENNVYLHNVIVFVVGLKVNADMKFPFIADEIRIKLIKGQYKKVKLNYTESYVLNILPNPDDIRELYELKITKPKIIGKHIGILFNV